MRWTPDLGLPLILLLIGLGVAMYRIHRLDRSVGALREQVDELTRVKAPRRPDTDSPEQPPMPPEPVQPWRSPRRRLRDAVAVQARAEEDRPESREPAQQG